MKIVVVSAILGWLLFTPSVLFAYLLFSEEGIRAASIAKLKDGHPFEICLSGKASGLDLERAKDWAVRSTITWFRVFKRLDSELNTDIALSCDRPKLTIILMNGNGRSFAYPSRTNIYNSSPYGTWTHELGHALVGLSDTYLSGAGRCKEGQPQSLMCWGGYGPKANPETHSTLWQDDIEGATFVYQKLFGITLPSAPSSDFDLESSFSLENPYGTMELFNIFDRSHEVEVDEFGDLSPTNYDSKFL